MLAFVFIKIDAGKGGRWRAGEIQELLPTIGLFVDGNFLLIVWDNFFQVAIVIELDTEFCTPIRDFCHVGGKLTTWRVLLE